MIDERIQNLANEFAAFWTDLFSEHPRYSLAFDWPSLGVLDLILYPLRGKTEHNIGDDKLLDGAAAYLAVMMYKSWRSFPDHPRAEVRMTETPRTEIEVIATEGAFLSDGQTFSISLVSLLKQILGAAPNPLPTFATGKRLTTPSLNLISILGTGLMTGLCPYGKGTWANLRPEEFAASLHVFCAANARSCADYYNDLFPTKTTGADPTLYQNFLILPPLGFDEDFPGARATAGLLDYARSRKTPNDELYSLSLDFLKFPNDLIASTGFITACAICEKGLPEALLAHSDQLDITAAGFRPAVRLARKMLGLRESWRDFAEEQDWAGAIAFAEREYQLGLLPLYAPLLSPYLSIYSLHHLFEFIFSSETDRVASLLDSMNNHSNLPTKLLVYRLCLSLFVKDIPLAASLLDTIDQSALSEDTSETRFRYYYAKGILSQLSGHDAQAIDAWEQALCEETLDHRLWAAVACEITENALAQGSLDYASDLLKVVLSRTPWKITANLQFLRLSYLKHERSQADDTLLRLIKLAPTNPRIFSFLKASLLSDRLKNTQD